MEIPIVIICYNNHKYVKNTIDQIRNINEEYAKNIIIVNNSSTCKQTKQFLENINVRIINIENNGPHICQKHNPHIYNELPNVFALTDPDLQFNTNLPSNFLEILFGLSKKYNVHKIGFALDISDFDLMIQNNNYCGNKNIYNWEKPFWDKSNQILDADYEMYYGAIDTTFALHNKEYDPNSFTIRVAGNFLAKHIPWYKKNTVLSTYELYLQTKDNLNLYTTERIIREHIDTNYIKISKNNEIFLFENNASNPNLPFWQHCFSSWENDMFEIFDKYLSDTKIMVDIGGWIGTTAMYGSRKSKHVYVVEADTQSTIDLRINLETNCIKNYTIINNAIYSLNNMTVKFGKNRFLNNSSLNDSTSQIYHDKNEENDSCYLKETITLDKIIETYNINPEEISLIKVDIEGGEEHILQQLNDIHVLYNIPLYVSFHYAWWENKDLDRFAFLTNEIKTQITNNPFMSIIM